MSNISGQLIKDSYNYVLQSDLISGIVYRIGGAVAENPKFISGLTVNASFTYSDGSEFAGYVLTCDASGNASWGPVSGASSGIVVTGGTFDYSGGTLQLRFSNGADVVIPGLQDIYITGGTVSGNSIVFSYNDTNTIEVSGITSLDTFTSYTATTETILNSKLDVSVFNQFAQDTNIALNQRLEISSFTAYTATTQPLILNAITGGTYSGGTLYLSTNSGGTIQITGFSTGSTSSTTGDYLPLSGGTVYGPAIFTNGITANTLSSIDYIDFDLLSGGTATSQVGRLRYVSDEGGLVTTLINGNVDLQIGQQNVVYCFNGDTVNLTKGQVVAIVGNQGNRPKIIRAIASAETTSSTSLGVVAETINIGNEGFVTTFGNVRGFSITGITPGSYVYLSPTIKGAFTGTQPQAPDHIVALGYVVRTGNTQGEIFVNINNGWELNELHNVRITNPTNNDILQYSAGTFPVWVNTSRPILDGLTANTISATTYLGDIITGATSVGTGTTILDSTTGKTVNIKSITSDTTNKVSVTSQNQTIELGVNEQNFTLWNLVVQGNKLLNGSVSYVSGLTFSVSPLEYLINGQIYTISAETTVTLASGDSTFDRIDVIYADISGNTGVLQGTPSDNPEKPLVNGDTEIEVTFVIVRAGSTSADVSTFVIYDENSDRKSVV